MSRWLCIFPQYICYWYWWNASRFSKDTSLDIFHSSCISNTLGIWGKPVKMGLIRSVSMSFWNMKINMEFWSLWKVISRLQEAQVLCCLGLAHVQVNFCYYLVFLWVPSWWEGWKSPIPWKCPERLNGKGWKQGIMWDRMLQDLEKVSVNRGDQKQFRVRKRHL